MTTLSEQGAKAAAPHPRPPPSSAAAISGSNSDVQTSHRSSGPHQPLSVMYPVNSYVELVINGGGGAADEHNGNNGATAAASTSSPDPGSATTSKLRGTVYTTDETSRSIVLLQGVPHTTLSFDVRMIHAHSILSCKVLHPDAGEVGDAAAAEDGAPPPSFPLPPPSSSAVLPHVRTADLEERERKALLRAEEDLLHVNASATSHGQAVFDRLVKACNVVRWVDGQGILVLNQVRVDPPYERASCRWVGAGGGGGSKDEEVPLNDEQSAALERVRKIVAG